MDKILTVVVPTYNMEKYLDRCLTSLIVEDAKMNCLEVLVINDGSKDCSSEIAHSYESKYPETFRVVDKENGNYGSCVNRGVSEATGKFIKVLDADDSFDNVVLSNYLDFLSKEELFSSADLIISDYCKVDENQEVINSYGFSYGDGPLSLAQVNDGMQPHFQMHGITYRTEMLKCIGYVQSEGISYTDQEWCFAPMAYVKTAWYFNKPLYRYTIGREGQTMEYSSVMKNMWMEIAGCKTMNETYTSLKSSVSPDACCYLQGKLIARICYIYSIFLCSGIKFIKQKEAELRDLDSYLKMNSSEMYSWVENYKVTNVFTFYPIRSWRRRQSYKTLSFYVYCFLRKVKMKMRRID